MSKKKEQKKSTVKHRKGTLERQELKRRTRKSPEWAELRELLYNQQNGIDPVTLRPLVHGNCHHLSQVWQKYDDLSPEKFVLLNARTHETVHFLYDIYKREGDIDRVVNELKDIVIKMVYYTEKDEKEIKNG